MLSFSINQIMASLKSFIIHSTSTFFILALVLSFSVWPNNFLGHCFVNLYLSFFIHKTLIASFIASSSLDSISKKGFIILFFSSIYSSKATFISFFIDNCFQLFLI